MTLRAKLILMALLEIALTVSIVGAVIYHESRKEIETLARDLLRARTEFAYALCERYDEQDHQPSPELKEEIRRVRIAADGYIAVIQNAPAEQKGVLAIHPNAEGRNINSPEFPHIQEIIQGIDKAGQSDRYAGYKDFRQGTEARGRQGEKKIGYYMYYKSWDWILFSTAYESDIFGRAEAVKERTIVAIAFVGLLAIFLVTLSIRKMFGPLKQLTELTHRVAEGNLDASIAVESKDEIGTLARSFNLMLRSLKQNLRISQEFDIARRMQAEMLPKVAPQISGLRIETCSLPATEVGGDFYDFLPLDGNRLGIVIGDVSGKGVSGAMVMTGALSAIRFAAEERQTSNAILERSNRRLVNDIQVNMFVAVFCGIFDLDKNVLYYSNAGQTMPLLYRNGRVSFLPQSEKGDRFPLGIRTHVKFEQMQIALQPGDLLVFYTDGIVDMVNGTTEPFGFERFQASIKNHANASLTELPQRLVADAESYTGGREHIDDLTLMVVKIEELKAPFNRQLKTADTPVEHNETPSEVRLSLPSCLGYEKLAMEAAAAMAKMMGFSLTRIEDLRTAVSETCINAIEHGNKLNAANRVDVLIRSNAPTLTVQVCDNGPGFASPPDFAPQLEKKICGEETPRGLGLFLIENLVDHVEFKIMPKLGHVTTLTMKL
jgi:serine phosphatase RsbU (regulator of sigma subunit)/anti-sigma regulatory factor (Ser/Thr protein kinase)